jgi:hypothetical protein
MLRELETKSTGENQGRNRLNAVSIARSVESDVFAGAKRRRRVTRRRKAERYPDFNPHTQVDAVHISRLCLAKVSSRARFRTLGFSRWRTTQVAIVRVTGAAEDQRASIGDLRPI